MATLLSGYANNRDNNFNLLRFIAASLVLYSHSYPLALGNGTPEPFGRIIGMSAGALAVDIFFITSGFLIAGSFFNRKNLIAFIWARVLRIYPALIVAVLFCVFVIGLFFTTTPVSDYFSDSQMHKFLRRNITLFWGMKYYLPGVFLDNPYKGAVNGSLWTLPYEIKMYSWLAFIAMVLLFIKKKSGKDILNTAFLLLSIMALIANIVGHFQPGGSSHFLHLFSMFFIGTAFYLYRDYIFLSLRLFLIMVFLLLLSVMDKSWFFVIYCIVMPYMVFYLAYVPSGKIRYFNKIGDYSYGIYIYAFPVQQSIVALSTTVSALSLFFSAFMMTFVLAFLSWHLVEKKCLKLKGKYIYLQESFMKIAKRIHAVTGR